MAENRSCDVLIVGAGPAGLAAAVAASSQSEVLVVDENPAPGGQIWRESRGQANPKTSALLARSKRVRRMQSASVFGFSGPHTASVSTPTGSCQIHFEKLILACGARELFLPFPGWTRPGVVGVGGLQALLKQGLDVRDRQIVIAGSGPLLIAVANYVQEQGGVVRRLFEQASARAVARMGLELLRHPSKLLQSAAYVRESMQMQTGWWVQEAVGAKEVEAVRITDGTRSEEVRCDLLACGYGLIANTELAQLAGCVTLDGFVEVDAEQRTSLPNIYAAGEQTEIGGVDAAVVQGSIAGFCAAGQSDLAKTLYPAREKASRFAEALKRHYALRPEVLALGKDDTIVCRCEDVRLGDLAGMTGFREAKLQTRLGMGPCQGRVCGAACRAIFGWQEPAVRQPLVPVELAALAETEGYPPIPFI